jgi:hypothetical protein
MTHARPLIWGLLQPTEELPSVSKETARPVSLAISSLFEAGARGLQYSPRHTLQILGATLTAVAFLLDLLLVFEKLRI